MFGSLIYTKRVALEQTLTRGYAPRRRFASRAGSRSLRGPAPALRARASLTHTLRHARERPSCRPRRPPLTAEDPAARRRDRFRRHRTVFHSSYLQGDAYPEMTSECLWGSSRSTTPSFDAFVRHDSLGAGRRRPRRRGWWSPDTRVRCSRGPPRTGTAPCAPRAGSRVRAGLTPLQHVEGEGHFRVSLPSWGECVLSGGVV